MRAHVFVGPTITVEEAKREFEAVYRPPVARGDVQRLVREGAAEAIGIIDGRFHSVRSAWHKEILWAMSRGIHVFGSASIGALRAAELDRFGMVGVGRVFEMFRSGKLEDDDEVAVIHLPAEKNHAATSVAMVNIRATLEAALAAGVIRANTAASLVRVAKEMYFPHRTYENMLAAGRRSGESPKELQALEEWLVSGQVDQKREDARAMLRAMREIAVNDPGPKRVKYWFEHLETMDG